MRARRNTGIVNYADDSMMRGKAEALTVWMVGERAMERPQRTQN